MENFPERRRQTVNTSGFSSGLRRSRSVRASLRKLGDRWKSQPKSQVSKAQAQTKTGPPHLDKVSLLDSSPEVAGKKAKNHPTSPRVVQNLNFGFQNESTEEDWLTGLEFARHPDNDASRRKHLRQHSLDDSTRIVEMNHDPDFSDPDFDIRKTEYYRRNREFLDANLPKLHSKNRRAKKLGYFFGSGDLETHQVYFSDRHEKSFGDDEGLGLLRIPRAVTLGGGGREDRLRHQQQATATVRSTSMWTSKLQSLENQYKSAPCGSVPDSVNYFGGAGPDSALGGLINPLCKPNKKLSKQAQAHLDRLTQINIHLQALFAAVEHGHLEKARTILESTDVDVNSLNSDGLSALDVAVLTNNRSLAKTLMNFGAKESRQFKTTEALGLRLRQLLQEAEIRIQELGGAEDENTYKTGSSTTGTSSENQRAKAAWLRRARALRRLRLGWEQSRPPDAPSSARVHCAARAVVAVRLAADDWGTRSSPLSGNSAGATGGGIVTKYKVQWSTRPDFSSICGEREMSYSGSQCVCRIADLASGKRYFIRAAAGNLKGWGEYRISTPTSIIPSSWKDLPVQSTNSSTTTLSTTTISTLNDSERLQRLDDLFTAVRNSRPQGLLAPLDPPIGTAAEEKEFSGGSQVGTTSATGSGTSGKAKTAKTTIRQLFTAVGRFQKHLRRGIYLACILYHDDKVLVTNEDFVPVIEVDETYPSCINNDYHWLMKVGCTWRDVRALRSDAQLRSSCSPAAQLRSKMLAAAQQMQAALGLQELGQMYHRPLRDAQGTLVLCCINYIKTPKSVSVLNSRWLPLNKIQKKMMLHEELNNINDILMGSIQEQINYHQGSAVKLSRGLYLGYLKLHSSVDSIQVVVPARSPNVLPYYKIRDNPHVTAEEWSYLKSLQIHNDISGATQRNEPDTLSSDFQPDECQLSFVAQVCSAAERLFRNMDIPSEKALAHRIYDAEVIELNSEASLIILCPSADQACSAPGQRESPLLRRSDLISLSVQAFEMNHLSAYRPDIVRRYSRLSCILESDTFSANQTHREAFSQQEVKDARERLATLAELQGKLNELWRGVRWLMDAIAFARDRGINGLSPGVHISSIMDKNLTQQQIPRHNIDDVASQNDNGSMATSGTGLKRSLLQIPPRESKQVKSSPGRGSWPGPTATTGVQKQDNENDPSTSTKQQMLLRGAEFSRSEQQLSRNSSSQLLLLAPNSGGSAVSSAASSRKNSGESERSGSSVGGCYYHPNMLTGSTQSQQYNQPHQAKYLSASHGSRLPPSRSEDALLSLHQKAQHSQTGDRSSNQAGTSGGSSARSRPGILSNGGSFSSPLLLLTGSTGSVRTADTNSDSLHSLSSDSETCSCPATSNVNVRNVGRGFKQPVSSINTGGSRSLCSINDNQQEYSREPKCTKEFSTISKNLYKRQEPKRPALELLKSPPNSKSTKTSTANAINNKRYLDFGTSLKSAAELEPGTGVVKNYVRSLNRSCENLSRVSDLTTVRGNFDVARDIKRTSAKCDQQTLLQQTMQYLRPTLEAEMQTLATGKENYKINKPDKSNHLSIPTSLQNSPKKQNFLTDFNSSNTTKSVSEPSSKVNSPERSRSVALADEDCCDSSSDIDKQILAGGSSVQNQQGIIQVYAAYDTGLAAGASLRLRVTNRTTAAEVVELVIRQLHVASVLRGGRGLLGDSSKPVGKTNILNTSRGLSLPSEKAGSSKNNSSLTTDSMKTSTSKSGSSPTRPTYFPSELTNVTSKPSRPVSGIEKCVVESKNINLNALSGNVKEKAKDYCLVAVIGARERRLRDDFRPLQLQDPWMKGRLYVRQRRDTLAAIEHSTRHKDIV